MPSFQDCIVVEVAVETRKKRFRGSIFGIRHFCAVRRAPKAINILSSEYGIVEPFDGSVQPLPVSRSPHKSFVLGGSIDAPSLIDAWSRSRKKTISFEILALVTASFSA